jgi:RNA polymerase sigma factor (sigma-70 family)
LSPEDAFDEELTALFRKYSAQVAGFLMNLGVDRDLAWDFTVDAFLVARRRWPDVQLRTVGYVFTVAVNLSRRYYRRNPVAREMPTDPSSLLPLSNAITPDTGDVVAHRLDLLAALQRLPTRQREVVLLHHSVGLTLKETADALAISEGTAGWYCSKGIAKLAELLSRGRT